MSLEMEEHDILTEHENSNTENSDSDNETAVQNSDASNQKEKFITEDELEDKLNKNAEKEYLDAIHDTLIESQILRPLFQNISASYADEVPFLVDGDSLLITLIKDNNWSPQLGGSSLHLIYLFERFLNIFIERGGVFNIVFFECWRNIWNENWNMLLYRSILIDHFKRNTSYTVHIFNNCFDEKFYDFLSYIRPGFILFNVDSLMSCGNLENIDKTMLRNVTNIHSIMWLYFDLPCVNTNFIEVDISTVRGYYLEPNASVCAIVKLYGKKLKKYIDELPKIEDCIKGTQLTEISPNDSVRKIVFLNAAAFFYNINQDEELIKIFFLTEALHEYLQLKNRCCPLFTTNLYDLNEIVNDWHKCMYFALSKIESENCNWKTVSDMWQGLLFGHVCRFAVNEITNPEDIGTRVAKIYETILNDFNRIGHSLRPYPIHLSLSENLNWETLASLEVNRYQQIRVPLVPIQNPLVLEFCGGILDNIDWVEPPANLCFTQIDAEARHYNIISLLFDEYEAINDNFAKPPTDPYLRKRYFKHISIHAKHMTIYGSSIEGRPLEISGVIRDLKPKKNCKKEKPKKQTQKAKAIIENINEEKMKKSEIGEKELVDNIKKTLNDSNLKESLDDINKKMLKIRADSKYQLEILFLKLQVLMRILKVNDKLKDNEIFNIKKDMYLCCHKICIFKPLNITKVQKCLLSKCLVNIGCTEIARRNGLLTKDDASSCEDDKWIRFQLEKLGPELVREITGEPDSRVNFIPDPWQKKLFDIVDKKESAVIVAPTSSGKTYASYYCMESILRECTDGVVVYVSPTKALVNQVAATVYARFKDTKMPDGMSVYGVFTRDYKSNTLNSQILVTVPEALEILLTCPERYDWVQRLKYVIFDEVHCIAGDIGAVSFERCLLLIRCPFLALSATIRHPRLLQSWLQKAEDFKQLRDVQDGVPQKLSYKVNLVVNSDRHSDLIKYTYGNNKLHHLHPYANLDERVIKNHNGIPKHFTLSPKETIQLYDAMLKVQHDSDELQNLSPVKFFASQPKNGFISRNMVQSYANALKVLLETWLRDDVNSFKKTIDYLRTNDMDKIVGKGFNYMLDNIVDFVLHLERNNMLPALIFSYNRNSIQYMAEELTEHFMDTKSGLNRRDEKKAIKQEKIEKKQKEKEAAKEKLETRAKRYTRTLSLISNHNEKSLQGIGKMTSEDIKYIEGQLMKAGLRPNDIWTNAIRNGIMMHHGGLGAKIRSSVEMLFRSRILNVVFATGTLALGIHMPCKTTVVAGSSSFLNSLEYQQLSGRAGRRGYDTTGNVIFFGINPRKQHSLLTAKLPELKGNYPVTVTYVLRLMLLVNNVTEKGSNTETARKVTVSRALAVLENALSYMHNPDLKISIKHFFSFSLQLLKSFGYINEYGKALRWVGLVTHLHYHEPGNLAFVHLLRSGAIRQLCTDSPNAPEDLLIVLSYLFNRLPLKVSSKQKFNNSVVILKPLPDLIRQGLNVYNEQVRFVFDQYLLNVATHFNDEDNELPLSAVKFSGQHTSSDNHDRNIDNLENTFLNMCTPKLVCSSFAGLSGNDDNNLYSSESLINNIRQKMSTDVKVIPLIDLDTALNPYALDFYTHGSIVAIRHDNGLKAGQEFTYLKDFRIILETIVSSLDQMGVRDENDIVFTSFKKLHSNFQLKYDKAFSSAQY